MKKCIYIAMTLIALLGLYSCGSSRALYGEMTINLSPVNAIESKYYSDMDYGVKIAVNDKREFDYIRNDKVARFKGNVPTASYISDCISRVMTNMGFDVYSNSPNDYRLNVAIIDFGTVKVNEKTVTNQITLQIELVDSDGSMIYSTQQSEILGFFTSKGVENTTKKVLQKVNWDQIAANLKRPKKPAQEVYAQVQGYGGTVLESTIIRWYIQSAPAGADVYWRIISSTPDVKNNNQNYLGTTPYESTESFDIIGLTYNNSGNVQIEISCEKAGYITQRKRFNVQAAIDQKEISTKFNLVKEY